MKKVLSLLTCIAIFIALFVPVFAVSTTVSVSLDKSSVKKSDTAQTVVMTLEADSPVTMASLGFTITAKDSSGKDVSIAPTAITGGDTRITFAASDYNLATGTVGWTTADTENISGVTTMAHITFTIPANMAAGVYYLGVEKLEISQDYGDNTWMSNGVSNILFEITDSTSAAGYTAGITSTATTVNKDESMTVSINATHETDTKYAAAQFVLSYDKDKLTYESCTASDVKNDSTNGKLTIAAYGADKNLGTGVYSVTFKGKAEGAATVTLTSAKLSSSVSAGENDLTAATISPSAVSVNVTDLYGVSFAGAAASYVTGNITVNAGGNYSFTVSDYALYDYVVAATMGGSPVSASSGTNGTYTVSDVSGNLVFTVTRSPKTFDITFSKDSGAPEGLTVPQSAKVTYGTTYKFNVPTLDNYKVTVKSVKIGENSVEYAQTGNEVTITGDKLTGNIAVVFAASKSPVVVTVNGNGAGDISVFEDEWNAGEEYTLTIDKADSLYKYTVTAKMGETTIAAANITNPSAGTYKIAGTYVKEGTLAFTVTKELDIASYKSGYVQLDGKYVWLIKVPRAQKLEGKTLTYAGNNMFWVPGYADQNSAGCYCYLVLTASSAAAPDISIEKFGVTPVAAVEISGLDVNGTGTLDANDAQLAYNIYNNKYQDFSSISAEKFLRADVNADGTVNVSDAAKIISEILK